eukprot:10202915-Ditylum_brightwellii.AAC.1
MSGDMSLTLIMYGNTKLLMQQSLYGYILTRIRVTDVIKIAMTISLDAIQEKSLLYAVKTMAVCYDMYFKSTNCDFILKTSCWVYSIRVKCHCH